MKAHEVIQILTAAIPQEDTWGSKEAYGPYNVDPSSGVRKILYCVTPTPEVVSYFKKNKYDLLISHHPFPTNVPQLIFHTALDCCKGGLNDQWATALGIKNPEHFDRNLGWAGQIEPISFQNLCKKIESFTERKILGQAVSKKSMIESVVVCSGLGGLVLDTALKTKADCYILGEALWDAKKSGFNAVIETGHTNSEWIGIHLFRKLLPQVTIDLAPETIDYFGDETYHGKKAG